MAINLDPVFGIVFEPAPQGDKRKPPPDGEVDLSRQSQRAKVASSLALTAQQAAQQETFNQAVNKWGVGSPLKVFNGVAKGTFGRVNKAGFDRVVKFQSPHKQGDRAPVAAWCAEKEIVILNYLNQCGARHVVKQYESASVEKIRYASLLERAGVQLRDIYLSKSPEAKQATLSDIKRLGRQFMEALIDLKKVGILHGDMKPENCGEKDGQLRIFDFGIAEKLTDRPDPNLKYTRYYRPPETVLEMGTSFAGDMWAVGCILFELITKQVLIPVNDTPDDPKFSDFDMMHAYADRLDGEQQVTIESEDPNSIQNKFAELASNKKYKRDSFQLEKFDKVVRKKCEGEDAQEVSKLIELITKMLQIDPLFRITPEEALEHPFFLSEESGSDLSFHMQISGVHQVGLRILNEQRDPLLQINNIQDLGCCYHIPRSEIPYKFEFFNREKPEIVLSSISQKIEPNATIAIHADSIPEKPKPRCQRRLF